jgi:signal transduction histidine kinase
VEKHADAGLALVTLRARPGFVELEVRDDGCGFSGPLDHSQQDSGLLAMRERLSLAGGELHIDSTRATGTRILARICLETEAA